MSVNNIRRKGNLLAIAVHLPKNHCNSIWQKPNKFMKAQIYKKLVK